MNQIFRFCKIDPFLISRHYGSQGKVTTHYETLRVPETASQTDIKNAFIKLSKEMHPDIKGNQSHEDFVKINEAYNVLSKEILKRDYDMNLKYGYTPNFSSYGYTPQSSEYYYRQPHFRSKAEYEQYRTYQAEEKDETAKRKKRKKHLLVAFICVVVTTFSGIIQVILLNKKLLAREEIFAERTLRYNTVLNEIKEIARSNTKEQNIQNFRKKLELARKDN